MPNDKRGSPLEYACPHCGGVVHDLVCVDCGTSYGYTEGIQDFTKRTSTGERFFDYISWVYESSLWYPVVVRLISGSSVSVDELVESVVDLLEPSVALDVACGTGLFSRELARKAGWVHGVDLSIPMLKRAEMYSRREGLDNTVFARADAHKLPFQNASFDGLVCCGALHLFQDRQKAVSEMARVLEPGSSLAVLTLTDKGVLENSFLRRLLTEFGIRTFSPEELRELVLGSSFEEYMHEVLGGFLLFSATRI